MARRDRAGARTDGAPASRRRRSGRAADRARRVLPFRHPRQARAERRRRRGDQRDRAAARRRVGASGSSLGPLTRAWQILLKGVEDVKDSPRPLASAEMALIRLAFAADLPTPGRRVAQARRIRRTSPRPRHRARRSGAGRALRRRRRAPRRCARARAAGAASAAAPMRRAAPRALRGRRRAGARQSATSSSCQALESDVRLARFEPGRIEFSLVEGASPAIVQALSRRLGGMDRASAGWWLSPRGRARRRCANRRRRGSPSA